MLGNLTLPHPWSIGFFQVGGDVRSSLPAIFFFLCNLLEASYMEEGGYGIMQTIIHEL